MENNKIKVFIFIIVVIIFIVGGFILMQKSIPKNETSNKNKITEIKKTDIKLDETKDYIYYSDADRIVEELDLEYKNVNINFKDDNNIAKLLNAENASLKETLKYDETIEDAPYDHLIYAKYMIYEIIYFDNYISLIIKYYSYDNENLVTYLDSKSYVFDKNSGKLISDDDLLSKFNLSKDNVKTKVKNHINDAALIKTDEELDADTSVNLLEDYTLYVDKLGRLAITFIVKSNQKDYNDNVILS